MNTDVKVFGRSCLVRHTTLRLAGYAECLAEAYTEEGLIKTARQGAVLLGKGSNVLLGDIDGLVVINKTSGIESDGCLIRAESGVGMIDLSRYAAAASLGGLEWACSIPGTVGGAAVMNASAFGSCFSDKLTKLKVYRNGRAEWVNKSEYKFAYRRGVNDLVLSVELLLTPDSREQIEHTMRHLTAKRFSSQPKGHSLGSVFKNPQGFGMKSAAFYIERCGFKGFTYKGLKVSEKHANFILNTGGEAPKDFLTLTGIIKSKVFAEYGIILENEFRVIGDVI